MRVDSISPQNYFLADCSYFDHVEKSNLFFGDEPSHSAAGYHAKWTSAGSCIDYDVYNKLQMDMAADKGHDDVFASGGYSRSGDLVDYRSSSCIEMMSNPMMSYKPYNVGSCASALTSSGIYSVNRAVSSSVDPFGIEFDPYNTAFGFLASISVVPSLEVVSSQLEQSASSESSPIKSGEENATGCSISVATPTKQESAPLSHGTSPGLTSVDAASCLASSLSEGLCSGSKKKVKHVGEVVGAPADDVKRSKHNYMEKMRRKVVARGFLNLSCALRMGGAKKPSKSTTLVKAREHVEMLKSLAKLNHDNLDTLRKHMMSLVEQIKKIN